MIGFTKDEEIMPVTAVPEPKRRFVPSKHEAKRVMKIVKAIREGRIIPPNKVKQQLTEEKKKINLILIFGKMKLKYLIIL